MQLHYYLLRMAGEGITNPMRSVSSEVYVIWWMHSRSVSSWYMQNMIISRITAICVTYITKCLSAVRQQLCQTVGKDSPVADFDSGSTVIRRAVGDGDDVKVSIFFNRYITPTIFLA